jgi:hypothetical protein
MVVHLVNLALPMDGWRRVVSIFTRLAMALQAMLHCTFLSLTDTCAKMFRCVHTRSEGNSTAAAISQQDERMHAERERELNSVNVGVLAEVCRAEVQ